MLVEGTKAFQGGEIMVTKALQHAAEDEKGKRRIRNMVMTMTPIPLGDDDDYDDSSLMNDSIFGRIFFTFDT